VAAASPSYDPNLTQQNSSNNPALNNQAFERAIARTGATDKAGMTAMGAYLKTGFLLILMIVAGAWGWSEVLIVNISGQQVAVQPGWTFLAFLLAFIFGMGGVFAGRLIPIFAIGYALSYGTLLGVAAHFFNMEWDGIVLQAIVVTIAVFMATWLLYITGVIKVTSKLAMGVAIAMGGLLMLYLVAWLLSLFGVNFSFLFSPTPLGIGLAVLIVLLAALNLPLDFEFIRRASSAGAPKFMEWYGAFGLMLSIVWMYVSILRLLALLRMRQ
jgi:uncharacterized YccA/Bax inhibitor family protein